jgi:pyruvate dehydrogenase E2 component (dihydrolipoamide acetyltransferase)
MAISLTVPRLGWNMEEGVFSGWLKQEGDVVHSGDAIYSLESEKSTEEVECLDSGILHIPPDGPKVGNRVAVGTVIGYLLQPGETAPAGSGTSQPAKAGQMVVAPTPSPVAAPPNPEHQRLASSPRARRVARELQVDWTTFSGSGRSGRIRERDVRAAAAKRQPPQGTEIPLSPVRRTIAERMAASSRSTAAVTLTTTAEASNLVNLRNQFKAVAGPSGEPVPSYTDFLVKLTALALQGHPLLNASWVDDRIITSTGIHIGIAVDTEAGLLVPVVRDVPALPLKQLAARTRELFERGRQRKLSAEEMQGGTFTVTNLGAFGIDAFTPIINVLQCAILGIGRIQRRPAVRDEEIVIRDEMTLSLTFDHRVVDGAPAARFLQTLSGLVENPGPGLMP